MLQWSIRFPGFAEFTESSAPFRQNSIRVFHSLYKVGRNGIIVFKGFNNSKKKLPPVGVDLMQEIITSLIVM